MPNSRRSAAGVLRSFRLIRWCAALFLVSAVVGHGAEVAKEYQIKAAFIFNFTKFVEWPPQRFASANDPVVIGVLGANPFGDSLEKIVRGCKAGGRDIVVVRLTPGTPPPIVHVLFVAAGEENFFDSKLAPGALTVGESERFTALGGMVTFIADAEKVRFQINLESAEQAELKPSAQLLKLASAVRRKW